VHQQQRRPAAAGNGDNTGAARFDFGSLEAFEHAEPLLLSCPAIAVRKDGVLCTPMCRASTPFFIPEDGDGRDKPGHDAEGFHKLKSQNTASIAS
jgi:hypothetical protein